MMTEASFASLGPTLLARKGGAKPAMRPQLTPLPENISEIAALAEEQLEDLGWNDMGGDITAKDITGDEKPAHDAQNHLLLSNKSSETSEAVFESDEEYMIEAAADHASSHPIIDPLAGAQVISITSHPAAPQPANEGAAPSPMARKKRQASQKNSKIKASPNRSPSPRRAAFTLRLDPDRHLKLRLAATMQGVSAQSLVTEALDAMLESFEDLDLLVKRLKYSDQTN